MDAHFARAPAAGVSGMDIQLDWYWHLLPAAFALLGFYWVWRVSVEGTFKYIPTYGLRAMWFGIGFACQWVYFFFVPNIKPEFQKFPFELYIYILLIIGSTATILSIAGSRRALLVFSFKMKSGVNDEELAELELKEDESEIERNPS